MTKMITTRDTLLEDLVDEILSRVPAASLARLRPTCKRWNALVNDGKFAKKHNANAPRECSLLLMLIDFRVCLARVDYHGNINENIVKVASQFSLKDPLSNTLENGVDINEVFHCDGLLLCSTMDNRLVVWNPCSRETSWIQPRKSYKEYDYYALGKSSCNEYKILRVDQDGHGYNFQPCKVKYEIYDFTSNSWRRVGKTMEWFIYRNMRRGTYWNGKTYWLACNFNDGSLGEEFLIGFDFSTERFERVPLPVDHSSYGVFALSVTKEEQQLCLLTTHGDQGDIITWVVTNTEITGAESWSKLLTVERCYDQQYFIVCNGMNFLVDEEDRFLMCPGGPNISNSFLHIVGEDEYIQVDHHEAGSDLSLLVSYVPTFFRIQHEASS